MDEHIRTRKGYSYHLVNIDCLRTSTLFNVVMDLETSIEDLLPYLAACLPGCNYVHGSNVIDFMDAGHIVGIYPLRITITGVEGDEEAERLCSGYFKRIEEVRGKRETLTPVFEKRTTLTLLDILHALPKTNCGACASRSCMAFAARVFRREARVSACPPFMEGWAEHRDLLREMRAHGHEVPEDPPEP